MLVAFSFPVTGNLPEYRAWHVHCLAPHQSFGAGSSAPLKRVHT
jgi:hypothetical protein